ncbi:MAG: hypothetical protein QMD85_01910 [Candidatus Aenigmarchaeota archaeon]|nr:hypothetical protein [Candidatus Aenigmarchaeota archaeon]MDI6722305.1 hypothetical protein [Candidatus Aenigmarchaeota archaeon]
MPVIKYTKALERVLKKPVFTPDDMHHEGIRKNYSKKLLFMLAKTGRIRRIERGKYTCLDDHIAVAAHITEPCYVSLWTAMSIRNLTTQIPFSVEVVTSRKRFRKDIDFQGAKIVFHYVSPKLMYGYENIIWKENIRILVARIEKIILDAVYFGSIPRDEIFNMIKLCNISRLKEYAKLTKNKRIENKIKELIKCSLKMR